MRIVHLSDLHFGRHDPEIVAGLAAEIAEHAPDLVVVSGDFTQIGTPIEFAMARDFLRTLAAPVFAVPGNHDVPLYDIFRRGGFTDAILPMRSSRCWRAMGWRWWVSTQRGEHGSV